MLRTIVARLRLLHSAFGTRGLGRRVWYLARLRFGALARTLPAGESLSTSPRVTWSHRFDLDAPRRWYEAENRACEVVDEAEAYLRGQMPLFDGPLRHVGWPPPWLSNPTTGKAYDRTHWTLISDDDPEVGDIKDTWELSRLPFTFSFARAFAATGNDRYPEAWWQAIEDWARSNPPNVGVNWRCGQESALRGIAICVGLSAFGQHASSTPERMMLAEQILGATRERVVKTLGYALSQRNNHAVSELAFLASLPGQPDRRTHRLLAEVLDDQWYPDGSYAQTSFVYQRLAIHVLIWLRTVQPGLPPELVRSIDERLGASRSLIQRCTDPVSGELPNLGPTDGSRLLRFDSCGPLSALPTLYLLGAEVEASHAREAGQWIQPIRASTPVLGPSRYLTSSGRRSLLLTLCGQGRHRASQDDQGSIELWIDGHRVVLDPGAYRYSGRGPWRNPFSGQETHSAARASTPPARIALGRFLRAPQPPARLVTRTVEGDNDLLVLERLDGDVRLVRAIHRIGDSYAVADVAAGGPAVIRWNLSDAIPLHAADNSVSGCGAARVVISGGTVSQLERDPAVPDSGWWSPTYGQRAPCSVIEIALDESQVSTARFAPSGGPVLSADNAAAAALAVSAAS